MLIQPKKKKIPIYNQDTCTWTLTIALFKTGSHWKTFEFRLDKL